MKEPITRILFDRFVTGEVLDMLYSTEAVVLDGIQLNPYLGYTRYIRKLEKGNIFLKDESTIYVFNGRLVNEHYDLTGEEMYPEEYYFSVISCKDIDERYSYDFSKLAEDLHCMYWRDIVDNIKMKKESNQTVSEVKVNYMKIKAGDMDKLYDSDALALEGLSMPEEDGSRFAKILVYSLGLYGIKFKDECTVYIMKGEDINKHYDLEGNNAYRDNFSIIAISFDDMDLERADFNKLKELPWRYWKDIVDNNEYHEYIKGRHEKSEQIQWLIDCKVNVD